MRKSWASCRHDLRRLASTPRAWAVLVLTILYVENQFAPIRYMLRTEGFTLSFPGMAAYFLSDAQVTMMAGLGLLLLLFDAPYTDETQRYIITRTGRGAWGRGQLLYVAVATVMYLAAFLVMLLAFQWPWTDWSGGWSRGLIALAGEGYYEIYDTMIEYDPWLIEVYAPVQALSLSLALHALAYLVLALVQYAVNVLGGGRVGFLLAAAPLVFDSVIEEFFDVPWYYFSPVTLSRLPMLDYGDQMGRPPLWFAFTVLATLTALLVLLSLRLSKRREILL
jgi:hypothetical protein